MSKWEMVRLGDVGRVQGGFAFKSDYFIKNEIPIIRIGNIQNDTIEIDKNVCYPAHFWEDYEQYRVSYGDILIAMSGATVGKIGKYAFNQSALLNQRVGKFIINNKQLVDGYLFHYVKSNLFLKKVMHCAMGCAQPNISAKQIEELSVPLPPIKVQEKIACILDIVTKLINLRKQRLAELDNLIKSVFYDMFGDPVVNDKEWETVKLGELGELARGLSKHRPRNDSILLGGEYPLIQTGDVANADLFIMDYKQTYSEVGLLQSKMWPKGTLCITIAANIAKTAVLNFDSCFPDSVVGFTANKRTNIFFIHSWFGFFQKILEEQAPESAQKNINLRILNELDVICPPYELQNHYAIIVEKVEEQKADAKKLIEESQLLFDCLMSRYFE